MDSETAIQQLAKRTNEPGWVTQLRENAYARHQALPWPHASDEIWRRTDVSLLTLSDDLQPLEPSFDEQKAASYSLPLGNERLFVRASGKWIARDETPAGEVGDFADLAKKEADLVKSIFLNDGLTEAEAKLATLNEAFHQEGVFVDIPRDFTDDRPWRLVQLIDEQPGKASFPITVVRVGTGSRITLIDEYTGVGNDQGKGHLVHGRIELILEPGAQLHYVRVQNLGQQSREFLLQRAEVPRDASLTVANLNLGAQLSKTHLGARLTGEGANSKVYGFVFGLDGQHIDQHTLQDHQAPHTYSDLEFKAALQDKSRMIYTGLIRIAKEAQQSEAYQENHNLLITDKAKAETIPMLEIFADDVQCKHGASTGPVDEEQIFYLMCRGLSRAAAERQVVRGFIESVLQQVPFEPLQEQIRRHIDGELHEVAEATK